MGLAGIGHNIHVDRLANQTCSTGEFIRRVREARKNNPKLNFDDVKPLLELSYGFKFEGNGPMALNSAERKRLEDAAMPNGKGRLKASALGREARIIMSKKAGIGWTTGGHTALPVLTTSFGNGSEKFGGFIENTDISKLLKELLRK